MRRDPTEFRKRFNLYRQGKSINDIYSAGVPRYDFGTPLQSSDDAINLALKSLIEDEGFRSDVYTDTLGVNTAGYGFTANKDLHTWTEKDARKRLGEMISEYDALLKNGRIADAYSEMTPGMLASLINLLHLGGTGVLGIMPKFVDAINRRDWETAGKEFDFGMKQTKNRSKRRLDMFINSSPKIIKPVSKTPDVDRLVDDFRNVAEVAIRKPAYNINTQEQVKIPMATPKKTSSIIPPITQLLEEQLKNTMYGFTNLKGAEAQ